MSRTSGDRGQPVVLAYDGSEDAANGIACAGPLLAPRQALVVHSFTGLSRLLLRRDVEGMTGPITEAAEELDAADREQATRVAAEGAELARAAGFEAQPAVVEEKHKAWRALIECAEKHDAPALVAGARGQSRLASALLGSVSNGLVHHSPLPVLVVPSAARPQGGAEPALLCYDGSDDARHAVAVAGELFSSRRAVVARLWESWAAKAPTVASLSGAVREMASELDRVAGEESAAEAAKAVELAAAAGFEAEPLVTGVPRPVWAALLAVADERDASVIVLGARGLSGLSAVLGGVSHAVVQHSGRPVLVVPRERA